MGRLRDECLNENWFLSVNHAREVPNSRRKDHNGARPHSSLGGLTPHEYAASNGNSLVPIGLQNGGRSMSTEASYDGVVLQSERG